MKTEQKKIRLENSNFARFLSRQSAENNLFKPEENVRVKMKIMNNK